ncbi:MAG: serine hydrolase [Holophagaceae bacterium]|nr:serine hydrolase [Holophagaceae bacterium]
MRRLLSVFGVVLGLLACGGGGSAPAPEADVWGPTTAAIQAVQAEFPGGLTVEIMTPSGVVYSKAFGGFTNQEAVLVASASKWVTSTVILRLVQAGAFPHGLDTQAKELLVDGGGPWAGPRAITAPPAQPSGIRGMTASRTARDADAAVKQIQRGRALGPTSTTAAPTCASQPEWRSGRPRKAGSRSSRSSSAIPSAGPAAASSVAAGPIPIRRAA